MRYRSKSFGQPKRPKKNLLIAGIPAVIQALESGQQLECIYLQQNLNQETGALRHAADQAGTPIKTVPFEKLKSFNVENFQGCIALKSKVQYQDLQDLISLVVEQGRAPILVVLDGVTDIRNIGAIARTTYACGIDALVIPEKGVGALNEDAIATSAGALEQLAVCRVKSLVQAIDLLHLNGLKVYASEMTASVPITEIDFTEPCAVLIGSEDKGIQEHLYKVVDQPFKIPMHHDFESLNVSVATGMILYEAMRQRGFRILGTPSN
ncbi:MAG: 23S rRNA (guanosine(2251)-2'-O)-methyltransferase RlmB [Bacteroidota bacterium]|nr:23S rRNA (guanosine(2251)-2'-O)-methyltransferase RlmB [Bacteroidota bacterium]